MGDEKFAVWFSLIVGPLVGGFLAYWIAASVLAEYSWCIVGEEHCVREWVSALSGWAAVVAAIISLPYLIGQWEESRRQTRFLIGDEEPTLDVVEHLDEEDKLVIRIVNWNRRAIFVWDVFTSTYLTPSNMNEYTAIVRVVTQDGETTADFPIQINGWEDRNNRPSFARMDLRLLLSKADRDPNPEIDEIREFPKDSSVWAKIQMLGDQHKTFDLTARAFPDEELD